MNCLTKQQLLLKFVRICFDFVQSMMDAPSSDGVGYHGSGSVPPDASGSVPLVVPAHATHPPLAEGALVGHGGAALRVFVGLSQAQHAQLENMGQLKAPRGRRGEFYWPLKTTAEMALVSGANRGSGSGEVSDVVLRPVSITYVGLREMLSNGSLYACDGAQWRLYGPLRMPPPRDENGFEFYEIHAAYVL